MTEASQLQDYVNQMYLAPGEGIKKAKLELAKVSGGLTDVLNLEQLQLTDEDMESLIGPLSKLGHNLRVLNLFLNQLKKLPKELGKLTHLEKLHLGCNPLEFVPEDIFQDMKNLKYLDIGYGCELDYIPDSIGNCCELRELWAGNNRIRTLPASLWKCTKLENLQVFGNDLSELSPEIGKLHSLKTLNVGRNQIKALPESVADCQQLAVLHAYENDLHSVPKRLLNLEDLTVANFYGNLQLGFLPREKLREGIKASIEYYLQV
eukprot:Plantae.Rhodophyta-Purpureofilum_apyrenoidigerum.ctg9955.p1 GENE.Plantae.Rhodophyta-Purpureofilum_apyrenoidigerum.ctg9955~~Plantae.Rhodophyta-Purpureofilum_apyrenoidigerum.ctg9955.p1  ORF type:complete len:283 (-),score=52.61 Plantae.Rhodophyta-Purpureofilum_apyrenoidigerum.ctg9955:585-1373(-)